VVIGIGIYGLFSSDSGSDASDGQQPPWLSSTGSVGATGENPVQRSQPAKAANQSGAPASAVAVQAAAHYHDLTDSLAAARTSLAHSDLTGARAALSAALSMQPDNEDAQALGRELAPREAERDAALQAAQACAKNGQWRCAEQSASNALAADSGSDTAKTLLEQAIVQAGWRTPASGASAPGRATHGALPVSPNTAAAALPASDSSRDADTQERATLESGWNHDPTQAAAASDAAPTNQ
jgi:hypothetical protein